MLCCDGLCAQSAQPCTPGTSLPPPPLCVAHPVCFVSLSCPQHGELWPILLEKAFAKLYGGYAEIDGGKACHGVADLMGCEYAFLSFRPLQRGKYPEVTVDKRALGRQLLVDPFTPGLSIAITCHKLGRASFHLGGQPKERAQLTEHPKTNWGISVVSME